VASADAVLGGSGAEQDRNVPRALSALTDAAQSVKQLASYLERHPEALMQGRSGGVE
jgi:paraquat-inducible protein B